MMNTTPTDNITVLELRSDGQKPISERMKKWLPYWILGQASIAFILFIWGLWIGKWGLGLMIALLLIPNMVHETYATLTITNEKISARCPPMPAWLRWLHPHHWDIAFSDIENIAYFSRIPIDPYIGWSSQWLQLTLHNGKKKVLMPAQWFVPGSPPLPLLNTGQELPLVKALRMNGLHVPALDSVAGPPDANELTSPAVKWFLGASVAAVLFGMLGNFVWYHLWVGLPLWWIYAGCCLAGCAIFGVFAAYEKPCPVWPHSFFAGLFWCIAMLFVVPVLHKPF